MKKFKNLLVAAVLVASSALIAGEKETKVTLGAGMADINNGNTYTQYNLGYTSDYVFDSNIVLGIGSILSYGQLEAEDGEDSIGIGSVDFDIRAGYKMFDRVKLVAIGSAVAQYFENEPAYGFGGGGALEFSFTKNFSIEAGHKVYSMTNVVGDYDYNVSYGAIKIGF